ncbi:MAG: ABC transporter permease [Deltaproteobacteria bacterium]|nr:ABC transporter permease [Deltaproteobacteria bacterium]
MTPTPSDRDRLLDRDGPEPQARSAAHPSAVQGILLIVRRELGHYFRTRSGYLIASLILALYALLYNVFAVGSTPKYSNDILSAFFYFASGITIVASLLISMRLLAEDRQNGALALLATSPLSDGQVVLAKYLSGLAFLFIITALTVYMPLLVFVRGKVSLGHLFAGYLGVGLLGAATMAIGLFGSSIANSQIVAVIIGGVITVTMLMLWMTSRIVDGPLGEVIAQLALHDRHFRPFMDGTIQLSSIVFYLSVTGFFLLLSRNVLEGRRWRA